MCNLYNITTNQTAIIALTRAMRDLAGNLEPASNVFAGGEAPIVRNGTDGQREMVKAWWGMPTSQFILMLGAKKKADALKKKGQEPDFKQLLRMERDPGQTNIRNLDSKHWKQWLGIEHRCVVPFTAFHEFNKEAGGDVWFSLNETRPLACFAGIHVPDWTSVRKVKDGETTKDLFAFLTTEPNAEVGAVHPKAMPVILRTIQEIDRWMTAKPEDVPSLQQPLPDNSLVVIARGTKEIGVKA
jgi:putative SOS response-associated peptidase YedK